jgi:hypothetical protein
MYINLLTQISKNKSYKVYYTTIPNNHGLIYSNKYVLYI